ncbi:acetylornithine transaminase [Mesobacillus harenae]|uniref:acetylornithine transaminase n=1 Tax=Mesobacillus harenae TaxID=2213203 RepID=UPI001580BE7D|nr:acetylornithine transaminase [Mesobacillus harenae]
MSHLFPTYKRWEVEPVTASGTVVTDKEGREYLDFTSGIGVCNLGHRPKNVEEAIVDQLGRFWHVSNLFEQGIQEQAAKLLAEAAALDLVFFANSGAEANEAAIKLAKKATGKSKIITFNQSFHGRTFGAMAATGQEKIKQGFGPMLKEFVHLPFNDLKAFENEIEKDTAAVMLEIVQGEGGIHIAGQEFLHSIEKACKKYGALLIIDEIQTGIGRTAKPFAYQHFGIKPDIVTVAKGLGSGLPIGAVIGKSGLGEFFGAGSHGSTFGGNPVSVAAAIATMESVFQEDFLSEVTEKGVYMTQLAEKNLAGLESVNEIRGLGMMVGIEMNIDIQPILKKLRDKNLLVLPAGENVIRLLPPLTVSKEEIVKAIEILKETIKLHSVTAV